MGLSEWLWANPVLKREQAQSRRPATRLREAGSWLGLLLLLLGYAAAAWWLSRGERSPWEARTALLLCSLLYLLGLNVIAPGPATVAISREREKRTWQALQLTALHPSQVVAAKFLVSLRPPLVGLGGLLPLILMALQAARLSPARLVEILAVLLATAAAVVSLSLWLSSRCRHSRSAIALAYLITTAAFWGALLWPASRLIGWRKLVWYSSPVWQLGILCLDEPSRRPLAHPMLPEWGWYLIECILFSGWLLVLLTRRLRAAEG